MVAVAVDSRIDVEALSLGERRGEAGGPQVDPVADPVDITTERHRRATGLVEIAGGRRGALEELRFRLIARLHRPGDDFAAIEGLRVVEAALSMIPRPVGLWAWQQRERDRRVRWWHRRRTHLRGREVARRRRARDRRRIARPVAFHVTSPHPHRQMASRSANAIGTPNQETWFIEPPRRDLDDHETRTRS